MDEVSISDEIERLKQAKRVLEDMDAHKRIKHFNMSTWLIETRCGTVGCLAGFCSIDSWFMKEGFKGVFIKPVKGGDYEWKFDIEPEQFFPRTNALFYSEGNHQLVLFRTTKLITLLETDINVAHIESWFPFVMTAFAKWHDEYLLTLAKL